MKNNTQTVGFVFALLDMVTYGLLPVFSHYFVQTIDPLLFGGLATLIGSLPLIFALRIQHKEADLYSPKFLKTLLLISLILTASSILFFVGTKLTSGINTGLLIQLEPFYGMLFGVIFLGELVGLSQVSATILMVLGAIVVVYKGTGNINIGDVLIFLVPLFNQLAHIPAKKIINQIKDANIIPAARLFYGGIILVIIALIVNPSSLSQLANFHNWFYIIIFGLIFRCVDASLWYQAIKRIDLAKASAVIPLSVFISFFGSILFLRETATTSQYLGLFLILAGLAWLSYIHLRINNEKTA